MQHMFRVRSARALATLALCQAILVHANCPTPSDSSRAAPIPASHARLSTRQRAYAFSQPLSFDTSKVTTMRNMFYVRSARALPPQPSVGPSACT